MSTETEAKPSGRGGARGPRSFKETPTSRDRVIGESLAGKVKELTGRDVSLLDTLAVKFSLSRWYEDPDTKSLLSNMDTQLKRAKVLEKKEKAEKELREALAELGEVEEDEDSDDADDDLTAEAASDEDSDEDSDDLFDDDNEQVSATF